MGTKTLNKQVTAKNVVFDGHVVSLYDAWSLVPELLLVCLANVLTLSGQRGRRAYTGTCRPIGSSTAIRVEELPPDLSRHAEHTLFRTPDARICLVSRVSTDAYGTSDSVKSFLSWGILATRTLLTVA